MSGTGEEIALATVLCALAGLAVPWLIGRLPEPDPPAEPPADEPRADEPSKVLYRDLGTAPGLGWRCALASGGAAAVVTAAVGRDLALLYALPVVPVLVALGVIDWHTKLLPSRLVLPATGALLVRALGAW
ncbi:MAG: hypothetical protein F2667_11585, partial [Actinobacteria bacterium]|nr:hypothetical protein [Actinomycetota bacterium]